MSTEHIDRRLQSLKFDEYKYAMTGVPFQEKWKLRIKRDAEREEALFQSLEITRPYVLVHDTGSIDRGQRDPAAALA